MMNPADTRSLFFLGSAGYEELYIDQANQVPIAGPLRAEDQAIEKIRAETFTLNFFKRNPSHELGYSVIKHLYLKNEANQEAERLFLHILNLRHPEETVEKKRSHEKATSALSECETKRQRFHQELEEDRRRTSYDLIDMTSHVERLRASNKRIRESGDSESIHLILQNTFELETEIHAVKRRFILSKNLYALASKEYTPIKLDFNPPLDIVIICNQGELVEASSFFLRHSPYFQCCFKIGLNTLKLPFSEKAVSSYIRFCCSDQSALQKRSKAIIEEVHNLCSYVLDRNCQAFLNEFFEIELDTDEEDTPESYQVSESIQLCYRSLMQVPLEEMSTNLMDWLLSRAAVSFSSQYELWDFFLGWIKTHSKYYDMTDHEFLLINKSMLKWISFQLFDPSQLASFLLDVRVPSQLKKQVIAKLNKNTESEPSALFVTENEGVGRIRFRLNGPFKDSESDSTKTFHINKDIFVASMVTDLRSVFKLKSESSRRMHAIYQFSSPDKIVTGQRDLPPKKEKEIEFDFEDHKFVDVQFIIKPL